MNNHKPRGMCGERQSMLGVGLAIGVAIGAGFGIAMDDTALGIGIGVALGIAIGIALDDGRQKRDAGEQPRGSADGPDAGEPTDK